MIIKTDSTQPRTSVKMWRYEGYLLNMVVFIFRFLASGNSQISMSFSYRIAPSTVHSKSSYGGLLLMSWHQNNKPFLAYDERCSVSHWPPASEISMLLITNFVELRMVAGRTLKLAGCPQAVSRRPMLIHTCNVLPMLRPCRAVPWP